MLRLICLVLLVLVCSANAQEWAPWPTDHWAESTPEAQGLDSALLQQADEYIRTQCPTRHTFLVIRNGYLVFERYYLGRSSETESATASISKNFISALVGIALDKGLIRNTDQRVLEFFPEYASVFNDPRKTEIRLRHLLSMTAGFVPLGSDGWGGSNDWFRWILARPMANNPGEVFDYNLGLYHVLAGIVAKASGQTVPDFASRNLFQPLGIRDPRWELAPLGYYTGLYDLRARDLAKFGYLYLRQGLWAGRQLVSGQWVGVSTSMKVKNDPVNYGGPSGYSMNVVGDYGYSWWQRTMRGLPVFFGAGGGGQDLFVVPSLNLVMLTMASIDTDSAEIGDQGFRLLRTYVLPAVKMQRPVLPANGAVNSATFAPSIAPGGFATLFGTNLTNRTSSWDSAMLDGRTFPTSLSDVTVTIAGKTCPVSYAGPAQVNVLVPPDVPPGEANVELTNPEGSSTLSGVQVRPSAPGVFAVGRADDGRLFPAALFPGTRVLVGPPGSVPGLASRPAKPGEAVEIYTTGLGPTAEPDSLREVLSRPFAIADPRSVRVLIDGKPAEVLGAWMTFAGLYQVNVVVPRDARQGELPLVVEAAGVPAQNNLVIAVRP